MTNSRKGVRIGRILGLALVLNLALAAAAAASPRDSVVIDLDTVIGSGVGTWEASGAIDDAGTFVFSSVHARGNFTQVRTVHIVIEFTGAEGTFTARLQTRIGIEPACVWPDNGHWVIVSGTGAYDGLKGTGSHASDVNVCTGSAPAEWDGSVHRHG